MTLIHGLARTLIAPMFITGGVDCVKHPESKAKKAEKVTGTLTTKLTSMGLPEDPVQLVRINGGVQLVAGSLLALGRMPRLASAALAATLVPTTLAGHRFWDETDPTAKAAQRTQFLKNLAMFGGLILAATDTNGAPSLKWRAKKAAGKASNSLGSLGSSLGSSLGGHSSPTAHLGDRVSALGERANVIGERAAHAATPMLERALHMAGSFGDTVGDRASHFGEVVADRAASVLPSR